MSSGAGFRPLRERGPVPDRSAVPTTVVLVTGDDSQVIVGRIDARYPDLALVDALARLQLVAARSGGRLLLRDAPDALRALLDLIGLRGVVGIEARRQPELGEHFRIDEVLQSDDLPA
jgi:hypothetical protein